MPPHQPFESGPDSDPGPTPELKLLELCHAYGLPRAEADDVYPLVERALRTPGAIGRCLMAVAEASLATRARALRDAAEGREVARSRAELDDTVLVALASVLHDWEPS